MITALMSLSSLMSFKVHFQVTGLSRSEARAKTEREDSEPRERAFNYTPPFFPTHHIIRVVLGAAVVPRRLLLLSGFCSAHPPLPYASLYRHYLLQQVLLHIYVLIVLISYIKIVLL